MPARYTLGQGNRKTGPMLTVTSERNTCPPSCPFYRKGCYAEYGPQRWQWEKVPAKGIDQKALELSLALHAHRYPKALVRYATAGDLPGKGSRINWKALFSLTRFSAGLRMFTFTHKPLTPHNKAAIAEANKRDFTINLSATGLYQADTYAALAIAPVVIVLADRTAKYTPAGRKIVYCPAEQKPGFTCADCKLCAIPTRKSIIAFTPHGTGKNHVARVIQAKEKGK